MHLHRGLAAVPFFLAALGTLGYSQVDFSREKQHQQKPFNAPLIPPLSTTSPTSSSAGQHGRFLHITDMHPDQYYTPGSSLNNACHQSDDDQVDATTRFKKDKDRVGHWGAPVSVCDSPKHLIEATLDWLADSWMPISGTSLHTQEPGRGIDFILWTGDTARHDIDFALPRTTSEILDYNRWAVGLLEERFPDVVVIPTIGNNDFKAHNIFFEGPNYFTKAYAEIWQRYIPEHQHSTFLKGGYFAKEVITDDLAVFSLNTLYWYDANAAVRGCRERDDPGTIQLDWMAETLDHFRNRSMQIHLMGHVPPTAGNYFEKCYERYTDIVLRYQDTIVGQHFGHMNVDAWYIQEETSLGLKSSGDDNMHTLSFPSNLRKGFDLVPTKQKSNSDAYSAFFVAPSVVPTYYPTVRVWTFNASRPLEKLARQGRSEQQNPTKARDFSERGTSQSDASIYSPSNSSRTYSPLDSSHLKSRDRRKKHSNLPRFTSSDSPSRKNTYLTLLGYSQWVLDLDKHNRIYRQETKRGQEHSGLNYQLEYTSYEARTLWSQYLDKVQDKGIHVPVPKRLLDEEISRLNSRPPSLASTSWLFNPFKRRGGDVKVPRKLRHLTDYSIPVFTVDHLLEWARELAGNDKMWKSFVRRIYTESQRDD